MASEQQGIALAERAGPRGVPEHLSGGAPMVPPPESPLDESIRRARNFLLSHQKDDGHWVALLGNNDGTLASDYIMFMHFMDEVNRVHQEKAVRQILRLQNQEGGWSLYPGGPSDVSACVKAYFALKLAGHSPEEPELVRAREETLRRGGLDAVNSFTKIYLAMFGQFQWSEVPVVPPELLLFPETFYFSISEFSSWSRAILIPLTIIHAGKPNHPLPDHARLDELFVQPRKKKFLNSNAEGPWNWEHVFGLLNSVARIHDRLPFKPGRKTALKMAEKWLCERAVAGGLGAVYPSMLNAIIAMNVLGYSDDDPIVQLARKEFFALMVEEEDTLTFQPCFSSVWDTAMTAISLYEAGMSLKHPAMRKAVKWLLGKECRRRGDWAVKVPEAPTGGWFFEYDNEFYPDTDDTVMTLLALYRLHAEQLPGAAEAMERGTQWLIHMQSSDGGWGAFDKDNNKHIFENVPFADHNALLDPSTSDITARMFELFGLLGYSKDEPFIRRAIEFLRKDQEPGGCWYGRWGVNYIYGTWQVLRGLADIGEDMSRPYVRRAVGWLLSIQNSDGGWGETCRSYDDPSLMGNGPSTPSQTAWAILGLLFADEVEHVAVRRGINYLLATQRPDGGWDETYYTGTGFPKVYYLEYTFYRHNFPLQALSIYRKKKQ